MNFQKHQHFSQNQTVNFYKKAIDKRNKIDYNVRNMMCTYALKGAYFLMKTNWKKTIAGITAIAALIPSCLGTSVYAAPAQTAAASITSELPLPEEPLPSDEVAAQIAADIQAGAASEASATVNGTPENIPMPNYAEDSDVKDPLDDKDVHQTEDGKLYYKVVSEKAHIMGCAKGTTDLVIPDTITTLRGAEIPVTFIGSSAFYGNKDITSVTLPDTLVGIGANAFLGCTGLTNVDIPDSCASINASAFCSCSNLKSVKLPSSLYFVGDDVYA